jgi:FMN phosphatase YigB (HAD superfamily)
MTSLPDAIIFDLDDTILDDSGSVDACWREVCDAAALSTDGIHPDTLLAEIERHRDWFWSDPIRHREGRLNLRAATTRIVAQALEGLGFAQPDVAGEVAEAYRNMREERVWPIPGAIETIEHFRSRAVRLGMATNGAAVAQRRRSNASGSRNTSSALSSRANSGLASPTARSAKRCSPRSGPIRRRPGRSATTSTGTSARLSRTEPTASGSTPRPAACQMTPRSGQTEPSGLFANCCSVPERR